MTVALERDRKLREADRKAAELKSRLDNLTPREREVMTLVAGRLGVSEGTVKVHRGRVMENLGARSVAELVKIAECAD